MTRTEAILCAKKVWRNGRGRTAKDRRDAYLRTLRENNARLNGVYTWTIANDFGVKRYFCGTFRQAKIEAHKMRRSWCAPTYVTEQCLGMVVYELNGINI